MANDNHPHVHANSTHCLNEDCGMHREHSYTHSHNDGHKAHEHPAEEGQLVIDLSEKKTDDNPEDKLPPKVEKDDRPLGELFR